MIIIMERNATKVQIQRVIDFLKDNDFQVRHNTGEVHTVIDALGDKTTITPGRLAAFEGVKEVKIIREPFRLASRDRKPEDTVIEFKNGVKIGGGNKPVSIVGPCSVEADYEGLLEIATAAKEMGCEFLRGGAFKPRTSPYSFQGLKYEGLNLLNEAKAETGLPIVTELMSPYDIEKFVEDVDVIQVGARNMQNFDLLKELGKTRKPILLKRGMSATIEELLMSAEYVMAGGNENVILCERGVRTFETYTRNTLDLSAVPAIKKLSHLPVIIDPSHATGKWWMVEPLAKAAVAVGADGLILEVHNDPQNALCDGQQSIKPELFNNLMKDLSIIASAVGREI